MTQGLQWVLLAEEEIAPAIVAMDGRRSRCAKPEHQAAAVGDGHTQDVHNAKLLRKLEAQGVSVNCPEENQMISIIFDYVVWTVKGTILRLSFISPGNQVKR